MQHIIVRNIGVRWSANRMKQLSQHDVDAL